MQPALQNGQTRDPVCGMVVDPAAATTAQNTITRPFAFVAAAANPSFWQTLVSI